MKTYHKKNHTGILFAYKKLESVINAAKRGEHLEGFNREVKLNIGDIKNG
ncbi:MAG: hypothetical protein LBG79_08415 [Spirochaetaceae bacterium]|jgi:hypothetical protein|nr:hypothetical protein [Spirochaetaceae bacterium]